MRGMILFLTLLGANVITNGAPATDHHTKVTVKRDGNCLEQFKECKETKSHEECEHVAVACSSAYFTEDEMYKYSERFCSLPAFCGGAKKRHTELKMDHDCFEDFISECAHENEEEIPVNELAECQTHFLLCLIDEHIENYPDMMEEGKAFCEEFREQVPKEPRDCNEELKECLEIAEDNEIAVAACDTNKIECELESAR